MPAKELTLFEQLEIQMKALVPFVRGLQAELGEQAVDEAIDRMRAKAEAQARSEKSPGLPLSANRAAFEAWGAEALEYEIVRDDEEAFDVDVTRCRYAEMMKALGAQDLGERLICSQDEAMALRAGHVLTRTQTCMGGASHCDFRFAKREDE
jgi:hypothetical protein